MSVQCIGSVLTATLLTCNLRDGFRLALTPGPLVDDLLNRESDCESSSAESNGSDEPGGYSQQARVMWPSMSHAGSGVSPKQLEGLLEQPPGSVLSFS